MVPAARRLAAAIPILLVALLGAGCDDGDDRNSDGTGERQENRTSLPDTQETRPEL